MFILTNRWSFKRVDIDLKEIDIDLCHRHGFDLHHERKSFNVKKKSRDINHVTLFIVIRT